MKDMWDGISGGELGIRLGVKEIPTISCHPVCSGAYRESLSKSGR
jgi:hypothetical protein